MNAVFIPIYFILTDKVIHGLDLISYSGQHELGYDSYLFFVNAESSPGDIPVHFFPGKLRNVLSSEVTQSPRRPPAMLVFNLRSYLFNS